MNKSRCCENREAYGLALSGVIAALYIVLTLAFAPLSFGPLQFRLSEGLNFLALYNKRYVYAMTVGVFIVNYFAFGMWDMIIGSLGTYVFLSLGRYLAKKAAEAVEKMPRLAKWSLGIQYAVLLVIFSLSMFTIAGLIIFLGAEEAFWPLYWTLAASEAVAMGLGGLLVYPIARRFDFSK